MKSRGVVIEKVEEHILHHYKEYLKRAYNIVKDFHDAEDVVQEAYCRALTYYDSFNPDLASFNTWFSTIFRRTYLDKLKDNREMGTTRDVEETDAFTKDDFLDDSRVKSELDKLINAKRNQGHRQVLHLYCLKGYKPREITQVLDVGLETVKQIVKRFKVELREVYGC